MIYHNPILDTEFLEKLYANRNHEVFAKIIALTFDELPIEEVQGRITSGSINIDGTSSVRRSCSLSFVADDINISNFDWGLNTKFKLEVGLRNTIEPKYPDTIWFKQGTYVITSFSISYTTNAYQISISGKDKMCLLNGEVGGALRASIDFGKEERYDNLTGQTTYELMPIDYIVREAVHEYAHEPWDNIVIELDETPLELLNYMGETPLYLILGARDEENVSEVVQYTFDGDVIVYTEQGAVALKDVHFDPRIDVDFNDNGIVSEGEKFGLVADGPMTYTAMKVEQAQTCGYRLTTLTYPGDLISSVGESLTSILDKIVAFLGHYEYFYDLDGRFIFRRQKTWIGKTWDNIVSDDGELYATSAAEATPNAWYLGDSQLITAFNNTPNLLNLRNDFTIWGTKAGISDNEIPVHLRYAIDTKPTYYRTISGVEYVSDEKFATQPNARVVDWREIIYQMAIDYRQHNHDEEFLLNIKLQNGKDELGVWRYPDGYTGYEQYYIDLEGFWRQLYCPQEEFYQVYVSQGMYADEKDNLYLRYKRENFGKDEYPTEEECIYEDSLYGYISASNVAYNATYKYYKHGPANPTNEKNPCWFDGVISEPEQLFFWFDFLDDGGMLSKYSVHAIGDRTKAVNDSNVKAIYFREVPTVIFFDSKDKIDRKYGYTYMQYPTSIASLFTISSQGKSAVDVLYEHLYHYSYCIESASITTIPIYHLEPNVRILIQDKNSGIDGEYIISRLSVPLVYNGTMSITATKAIDNIY